MNETAAERSIIADPGMMRGLLAGTKTQARQLATSFLGACRPEDRVWVRESCVVGRMLPGGSKEVASTLSEAEFAVFLDGIRRNRSGAIWSGPPPVHPDLEWTPAVHMPRWASRAVLVIESNRAENLQNISRSNIVAEGLLPVLGGLLWRWPKPVPGLWLNPRHAFAAMWDITHSHQGERWQDDPVVAVLNFRVERDPAA